MADGLTEGVMNVDRCPGCGQWWEQAGDGVTCACPLPAASGG